MSDRRGALRRGNPRSEAAFQMERDACCGTLAWQQAMRRDAREGAGGKQQARAELASAHGEADEPSAATECTKDARLHTVQTRAAHFTRSDGGIAEGPAEWGHGHTGVRCARAFRKWYRPAIARGGRERRADATADHAAKADKLYNAWKKDALGGRPAGSTQMEANKASPKRARGRSHERRTLEPSSSQTPSACRQNS